MFKPLKKLLASIAITAFIATPAIAQQGKNASPYITFSPSFPSETPNKIELIEFFSYVCSHCAAIEPAVEALKKELPDSVAFIGVPIANNAAMQPMQRMYYTLVALNRLDLHPKFFHAIQVEKKPLFTDDEIINWVAQQQGVNKQAFTDIYHSFGVSTKIRVASELTERYNVMGTPSFAVGGKYLTSPGMTGSYEATIAVIKDLLKAEIK